MSATARAIRVASASDEERTAFLRRTYAHLAGAVLAFVAVEAALLQWDGARDWARRMTDGTNWLLVLLAFAIVSTFAHRWARSSTSLTTQYLGLGTFVVAEAVIFMPLLLGIRDSSDDDLLPSAALITFVLAVALSAVPFVTGADFSFLRGGLVVVGLVAFGLIVAAILFGFSLGPLFSAAMIGFAGASVLYHTSEVLRTYRTDQHVAAALALFASVALLFWYVLRLMQQTRR